MSENAGQEAIGDDDYSESPASGDEVLRLDEPEYDVFEGSEPVEVFGTSVVVEGDDGVTDFGSTVQRRRD